MVGVDLLAVVPVADADERTDDRVRGSAKTRIGEGAISWKRLADEIGTVWGQMEGGAKFGRHE